MFMEKFELLPTYDDLYTGFERRPSYNCTVSLSGHLLMKDESDSPYQRSTKRTWQKIVAELRGTCLILHTGLSCRVLSLQAGDIGVAADYVRRSFVLRTRAEGRQFLLATRSIADMFRWYEGVNSAIAISLPLELRKEPKLHSLPRSPLYYQPQSLQEQLCCAWREKWRKQRSDRRWLRKDAPGMQAVTQTGTESCSATADSVDKGSRHSGEGALRCFERPKVSTDEKYAPNVESEKATEEARQPAIAKQCGTVRHPTAGSVRQERFDDALRVARELLYNSPWRSKWYFREGRSVNIEPPSTASRIG